MSGTTASLHPPRLANIGKLEAVYLYNVGGGITTTDIVSMAQRCPDLHSLVLDSSPKGVDWRVIRGILDVCPKLSKLVYTNDTYRKGGNTDDMKALVDMIQHFYPHVCDLLLNF